MSLTPLWKDRKRTLFGLPWSFTRYELYEDKLLIDIGFWSRREEEIRLYRITDITLKRSFGERIFGLGTIHCCSGDKSSPEFDIKRIKNSRDVRDQLSELVEQRRSEQRIGMRELLGDVDDVDDFISEHDDI